MSPTTGRSGECIMRQVIGVLIFAIVLAIGSPGVAKGSGGVDREARIQERLQMLLAQDPQLLRRLLKQMPKGDALHSHLSGAVKAELLIRGGAADGLCVHTVTFTATLPPCCTDQVPLAQALVNPILYDNILAAWSMEGFQGTLLEAHQHGFDTFGKFGATISVART